MPKNKTVVGCVLSQQEHSKHEVGAKPHLQKKQLTLKDKVTLSGVGLHTGKDVELTVWPAPPDTGIIFRRVDQTPTISIPALTQHVSDTRLNTALSYGDTHIFTIEHFLSAVAGLKIDNVFVDLNGSELPAMDGSARPFVEALQQAGIAEQNSPKRYIRIKKAITVQEGDKTASLIPFDGSKIAMRIAFEQPVIAQTPSYFEIDFAIDSYQDTIGFARTFGFMSEYEYLLQHNLALGASLDNTIALKEDAVLNAEGLRDPAEFVKHKILDALGDLRLLGHNFIGAYEGYKASHALNHALRTALLSDPEAWEIS